MKTLNKFISLLTVTLCLLMSHTILAQVASPELLEAIGKSTYINELDGNAIEIDSILLVRDDRMLSNNQLDPSVVKSYFIKDYIIFEIVFMDSLRLDMPFSASISLAITYLDSAGNAQSETVDLDVYRDTLPNTSKMKAVFYNENGLILQAQVLDLDVSEDWVHKNLVLRNEIHTSRLIDFDCEGQIVDLSYSDDYANNQELTISWQGIDGSAYDLEWTFLTKNTEDYELYGSPSEALRDELFKNNSTRVRIDATSFTIKHGYPEGIILYRVRPVQYQDSYCVITGAWTNSIDDYYECPGVDLGINWKASLTLAEEGKTKLALSYFDGIGNDRQALVVNNSENATLVSTKHYNKLRQLVASTLPAPYKVDNQVNRSVLFIPDFNVTQNGSFSSDDLSSGYCDQLSEPLDNSSGAGRYYSENSEFTDDHNRMTPNANGYPYSQTIYTNDNTGRVAVQSGFGDVHKIGGGHERNYFYTKPTQEELYRLFGLEVGDASFYTKEAIQDENGQFSISYKDSKNRVIATALAGESPSSLVPLSSTDYSNEMSITAVTQSVLRGDSNDKLLQQYSLNAIEVTQSFLVTNPGTYQFDYLLLNNPKASVTNECNDDLACYDCKYDVKLELFSICDTVALNQPITQASNYNLEAIWDTVCEQQYINDLSSSFYHTFTQSGLYFLTKKLTLNQQVQGIYRDHYVNSGSCKSFGTFYQQAIAAMSFDDCEMTCEQCLQNLGTLEDFLEDEQSNYPEVESGFWSQGNPEYDLSVNIYYDLKDKCSKLCNEEQNEICDQFYQMMLMDVSPGGQYFNYTEDPNTNEYTCDSSEPPSVLCKMPTDNNGNFWNYQHSSLIYTHEDGTLIYVTNDQGVEVTPNELTISEFINKFQAEWAKELVKLHPEYCLLSYCSDWSTYLNFDNNEFGAINTFQEAVDNNYITTDGEFKEDAGVPGFDPVFNGQSPPLSSTEWNDILSNLNSFFTSSSNSTYTVLQFAIAIQSEDPSSSGFPANSPSSYTISSLCEGEKNHVWQFIKTVYLKFKFEKYIALRNEFTINNCIQARCIGYNLDEYKSVGFCSVGTGNCNIKFQDYRPRFTVIPTCVLDDNDLCPNCLGSNGTVNPPSPSSASEICSSYLDSWRDYLDSNCGYSQNDIDAIVDDFLDLCESMVDEMHPYGASSNSDNTNNFQLILDNYPPGCSSLGITMPPAYNQTSGVFPIIYNIPDQGLPSCICDKLTELKENFETIMGNSYTYNETDKDLFAEYLKRNYESELTGDQIQDLLNTCDMPNCSWLNEAIVLPDILQCLNCINCEELLNEVDIFNTDSQYSSLQNSPNVDLYRANYLNKTFGFNFTWREYADYITQCSRCDFDSCAYWEELIDLYRANSNNEQDMPFSFYMNLNTDRLYSNSYWLNLFYERCQSVYEYAQELLVPFSGFNNSTSCTILLSAIQHYWSNYTGSIHTTGELINFIESNYWDGLTYNDIGQCGLLEDLNLVNENQCSVIANKFDVLSQLQSPIIQAYDSLISWAYLSLYPNFNKQYAYNALQLCGIEKPVSEPSCTELNEWMIAWQSSDLDTPISFTEWVNTLNSWNYPESSYNNWIQSCSPTSNCLICYKNLLPESSQDSSDCYEILLATAQANAQYAWEEYLHAQEAEFDNVYRSTCLEQVSEKLTMEFQPSEYHYTLYYYDKADNLAKTIPPQGVYVLNSNEVNDLMVNGSGAGLLYPPHEMMTSYGYNSYNQVIHQETPDAGEVAYWYDELGRIVLSQNALQLSESSSINNEYFYSYTIYDNLSRIVESGKLKSSSDLLSTCPTSSSCTSSDYDGFITNSDHMEVAQTTYDETLAGLTLNQNNLNNRVSSQTFTEGLYSYPFGYNYATHYSYDIAGNVNIIYQENRSAPDPQQLKTLHFLYDLISGKVNKVIYQYSSSDTVKADQFVHKYTYDADNRLKKVEISTDGQLFTTEANYAYYLHGPLARILLGEHKVQGLDYAYTIQGWLKSLNSGVRQAWRDIGRDGWIPPPNTIPEGPNEEVGRDALAFTLSYFNNDYSPVDPSYQPELTDQIGWIEGFSHELFNGNIRSVTMDIQDLDNSAMGTAYSYDQLNRLKATKTRLNPNFQTWEWDSTSASNNEFDEPSIAYDKNGNIKSYIRYDASGQTMDSLSYYPFYSGGYSNNQLAYVEDGVSTFNEDIGNQLPQNYSYDANGNLIGDDIEGLSMTWTNAGKLSTITNSIENWILEFHYDAMGNRVEKRYLPDSDPAKALVTYYVRDAQGNIMATYKEDLDTTSRKFYLDEWVMYGSSRLGTARHNENLLWSSDTHDELWTDPPKYVQAGLKNFELTNHLGNVMLTVSDVKTYIDTVGVGQSWYWNYTGAYVKTSQDYYPFGMIMPGRNYNAGDYRFGFNGKENDNEVKGVGNSLDFGARIHDPRLGRFLSVDPDLKQFPYWSPYLYAGNTPILYVDIDGRGPGTHFIFFEGVVAVGVGAAGAYIEQSGIAYDRAGKTHFTITTKMKVIDQGLENEGGTPNLYVGFEGGLSAGYKYDKRSSFLATTAGGNGVSTGGNVPKARGKFGIGGEVSANSLSVTLGLSGGAGVLYAGDNVDFSVSLSDREANIVNNATDVWSETWQVGNRSTLFDKEGNITGYQGSVTTKDTKGKVIDTGIKVFSGVSIDTEGNSTSNNIWSSNEYNQGAKKAADED